ncbi:uncharacterized protein LY89DRAFT_782348 [Mollisia scopiformis]|uniref:Uncharacterized protein n=1 Tax=Mollisia scopiformis TaxID=149040 RepID=A0A194XAI7_MOLSC|nr:uncharacterized protein LY89DRAFT_782348 [Mollisia scopiformis]KUJ17159.1 hypothetical protein LY89DRAFT_782348 [Mollisia scopiformis]
MPLPDLIAEFASGLEAATRAIYHSEQEICTPTNLARVVQIYSNITFDLEALSVKERNVALATTVRQSANTGGWLQGWKCLVESCPGCGVHEEMLRDVEIGVQAFQKVEVATKHRPAIHDIHLTVVSEPKPGRIDQLGPKSLGGKFWEGDLVYLKEYEAWCGPAELLMGPCVFFAWIGICKKVPRFNDPKMLEAFWTAQMLGIVDYDLDQDDSNIKTKKFKEAMERTAKMGAENEAMRGVAWTGLLTMDQQTYNRQVQYKWVAEGKGCFVTGPSEISPYEYLRAGVADCASLTPFAHQTAAEYIPSRKGMFLAVLNSNLHDLIYDMGSSSRISCAGYAFASGSFEHDLPQAFIVSTMDAAAEACLNGPADQSVLYGNNTNFVACLWNLFNIRYRTWERLIKYTRLLQRSNSPVASKILNHAKQNMVFPAVDIEADVEVAFKSCLEPANANKLVPRALHTSVYTIPSPVETLAQCKGFYLPGLCESCKDALEENIYREDTIQTIKGIPQFILNGVPVTLAAAVRRASIWATSDKCCDGCACVVGEWTNSISDRVTVASMQSEQRLSPRDWLLECYAIGCVAFSPLRLISITGGFDAFVDIRFEPGAMGEHRDIVDC